MPACGYCGETDDAVHREKCGERLGLEHPVKVLRITPAREEVLDRALDAVRDREGVHGPPAEHFDDVAIVWGVILGAKVEPWQVPACMAALKLLRLKASPEHLDNWIDAAGYAALGGEIAR